MPPPARRRRGRPAAAPLSQADKDRIQSAFTTPGHPVAYSTPARVAKHFGVRRYQAASALNELDGYTLHREFKQPRQYNPYYVHRRREIVQADLVDVSKIAASNDGVKFLLVLIDIMTKKLWVVPLQNKSGTSMARAMRVWLESLAQKPAKLQTDLGLEFRSRLTQAVLGAFRVQWEAVGGTLKASIAERVNKTLQILIYKYLSEAETVRYIDKLADLVKTYNGRGHRTLKGMTPDEADRPENEARVQAIFHSKYTKLGRRYARSRLHPRLQVGDRVRVKTEPKKITSSSRSYAEQFHGQFYEITFINRSMVVPMYYLRSLDTNESVKGGFYAEELQKVEGDIYKVDRVLKRRGPPNNRQFLVQWKWYGPRHNSWVRAEDLRGAYNVPE